MSKILDIINAIVIKFVDKNSVKVRTCVGKTADDKNINLEIELDVKKPDVSECQTDIEKLLVYAKFFGANRILYYADDRLYTRVADKARTAMLEYLEDNKQLTTEQILAFDNVVQIKALAKNAISNFPDFLSDGQKRKGSGIKLSNSERNRNRALSDLELIHNTSYTKLSAEAKKAFDARYPVKPVKTAEKTATIDTAEVKK
jgi:hypothetical protein